MKRRTLTPQQKNYLVENYPNKYAKEVADELGISLSCVYNNVYRLGIKKSPEWLRQELEKQANRLTCDGVAHRFKKGHVPFNKGKNINDEWYQKIEGTMFKKGQRPANWKPDGSERIDKDGYIMLKVNGRFQLKHKYIWEQVNGPMPKGHAIVYKDGNKLNVTIENLECISRIELMNRNTIHNYPSEIVGVMKILKNLKKKINAKEQN